MTIESSFFALGIAMRSRIDAEDDGFHIVDEGVLEINRHEIWIQERETREIKLAINFFTDVRRITYQRFHSAHSNYVGWRVVVYGRFDRPHDEKITLCITRGEYQRFKLSISTLLASHQN